jgi:radical SAM protein with 4Fe4S-binding SPASM domain
MEQITRWFCESLNPSMINFEVLCPTSQTEKKNLFPPGPYEFAKNFIRARNAGQEYGIKVVFASDLGSVPTVSSCPVGKDTAIFTPDGRINSCYLNPERWQSVGLDLCIGKIDKFGTVVINDYSVKQIRMMVEDKPRCDACFCQWNCAGGCHVGLTFPGCDENYDDFCIQTRIISACSLLSDLGLHKEAELLINDDACLTNLANNKSDLLTDIS